MNLTAILLLTFAAGVHVEATTLDGKSQSGELTSLTPAAATLAVDGDSREVAIAKLHQLQFGKGGLTPPSAIEVQLSDGSLVPAEGALVDGDTVSIASSLLGDIEFAKTYLANVRLANTDRKVQSAWEELTQRESRDDLVVVRKGDALDHVGGVVSAIDKESVRILLDGSPVPIPRARVFGVVFASPKTPPNRASGRVELADGGRLQVVSAQLANEGFELVLPTGARVVIAPADVRRIDFSLGKIRYLTDVEPTRVNYPTDHKYFVADVWKYRHGQNSLGDPLQIGGNTYDRGLWIHSGTTLTYRLGREFGRLSAIVGIDEGIGEGCSPKVGLVIRGDGRELFNEAISRGDASRMLDLNVSGVRELEIEVTSTDPDGICEHLVLGDVRAIK